jgi:cell division protein FtsB
MEKTQDAASKPEGKNSLLRRGGLALVAVALLVAFGKACGTGDGDRKAQPANPSKEGATASDHSRPPDGFDELTMAHEYKTSVASQSHRVVTLEQDVTSLKRSIEDLRGQLTKAVAGQETQYSRLGELTKLLEGMAASPRGNVPQPGLADPQAAPEGKAGVRLISFDAPPGKAGPPKRLIRIPSASAGEATLMNGVFAPTSGEPSPARFRLDAALVGPTRSRIPLENASWCRTSTNSSGWNTSSWEETTPRNSPCPFSIT